MPSLVRHLLVALAAVVVPYLVVGAVASACYQGDERGGSVVPTAEGAFPATTEVSLDVPAGQATKDARPA